MTCLSHHESLPSLQAKAHDYQAIELNLAIGLGIGKLSLGICKLSLGICQLSLGISQLST